MILSCRLEGNQTGKYEEGYATMGQVVKDQQQSSKGDKWLAAGRMCKEIKERIQAEGNYSGKKARIQVWHEARLLAEGLREAIVSGGLLSHLSSAGIVAEEIAELH